MAAYICSHNPPRLDSRYFSKGGGPKKKARKELTKAKIQKRPKLSFPVERMFMIFHHLMEEPYDAGFDLQVQVFFIFKKKKKY